MSGSILGSKRQKLEDAVDDTASEKEINEQSVIEHKSNLIQSDKEIAYQNSCYNRNCTSAAKYVDRVIPDFPSPSERYYDIRLVTGEGRHNYFGDVADQCIMFHSNRICVITIAPSHPIIVQDKTIVKVEHTFEGRQETIDRAQSIPQGKCKKGTQKVQKNSPICALFCSDSSKYVVTGSLTAKLIEINFNTVQNPQLIKSYPLSKGYIAILQPSDWRRLEEVRNSLPKLE